MDPLGPLGTSGSEYHIQDDQGQNINMCFFFGSKSDSLYFFRSTLFRYLYENMGCSAPFGPVYKRGRPGTSASEHHIQDDQGQNKNTCFLFWSKADSLWFFSTLFLEAFAIFSFWESIGCVQKRGYRGYQGRRKPQKPQQHILSSPQSRQVPSRRVQPRKRTSVSRGERQFVRGIVRSTLNFHNPRTEGSSLWHIANTCD